MKKTISATAKDVHFEFAADPYSQVSVAGTFNNWNPTAHPLRFNPDSGHYEAQVEFLPGLHEYLFIIDGAWCLDPACPDSVPNEFGGRNSVRRL